MSIRPARESARRVNSMGRGCSLSVASVCSLSVASVSSCRQQSSSLLIVEKCICGCRCFAKVGGESMAENGVCWQRVQLRMIREQGGLASDRKVSGEIAESCAARQFECRCFGVWGVGVGVGVGDGESCGRDQHESRRDTLGRSTRDAQCPYSTYYT
jgi:hypothetical protein